MKANRKFLHGDDDAVSPVIAVILMVAITVVLAATVYVWVSGFGANGSAPAKSVAFASAGAIATETAGNQWKTYTVASASPGLKWTDLTFKLGGTDMTYADIVNGAANTDQYCVLNNGATDCLADAATAGLVSAGNKFRIEDAALSGQEFLILDSNSNSIILTLTVS